MQPQLEQHIHSILIADDQPAFRQFLRQVLADLTAEIIECADGVEAVAAFEKHQPDWALLDWTMPNLDGVAAARSIRAQHPQARVVLLSVHSTPMLAQEAAQAGACACFPKERLQDLLTLLRAWPRLPGPIEPPQKPRLETL